MKQLLLLTVLGFAATLAQAGHENAGLGFTNAGDQAIYKALNVEEIDLNPGIAGVGRFGKIVGGLKCERSQIVVPNAQVNYDCAYDVENSDDQAIYESLNVEAEILNAGIAGVSRTRKSVGDLTCYSSLLIYPGAETSYSCSYDVEQPAPVKKPRHGQY